MGAVSNRRVISPTEDSSGKVLVPSIDLDTLTMPNGQSVESFYEGRTEKPYTAAKLAIRKALHHENQTTK